MREREVFDQFLFECPMPSSYQAPYAVGTSDASPLTVLDTKIQVANGGRRQRCHINEPTGKAFDIFLGVLEAGPDQFAGSFHVFSEQLVVSIDDYLTVHSLIAAHKRDLMVHAI
jgi:hypothetical protein